MTSEDCRAVPCPTCGTVFLSVGPCRGHHLKVHKVSLVDVPVEEWESYVHKHRAQIANPSGRSSRDRAMAERHPAYRASDD